MTKIKLEFNKSEAPLMANILSKLMECAGRQELTDNFIEFMVVKTIKKLYHAHFTKLKYMDSDLYAMKLEHEHAACLAAATQVYYEAMLELHIDHQRMIITFNGFIHQKLTKFI